MRLQGRRIATAALVLTVALASVALALASACAMALLAQWGGWYVPIAAPVATLLATLPASWMLDRNRRGPSTS